MMQISSLLSIRTLLKINADNIAFERVLADLCDTQIAPPDRKCIEHAVHHARPIDGTWNLAFTTPVHFGFQRSYLCYRDFLDVLNAHTEWNACPIELPLRLVHKHDPDLPVNEIIVAHHEDLGNDRVLHLIKTQDGAHRCHTKKIPNQQRMIPCYRIILVAQKAAP